LAFEITAEGTGSGSILDKAGHIVTNFHVIADASDVVVTAHDGKQYDAVFVGADPENDIAVIRIKAPPEVLYPVALGDSSRLRVGMKCFAIGNPFGLERTLTTGTISSIDRSLQVRSRSIKQIIQIDAAINPGNSGGPLIDTHGRLIGINTAIASKTGQSAGVGFAIPANLVARVVTELIRHGKVIRPEVGVQLLKTERGLLVAQLQPGGPAERAGLRGPRITRRGTSLLGVTRIDYSAADIVLAVDGEEVKSQDDFLNAIERKRPNDQVELTVLRDGKRINLSVTLGGPNLSRS
jgi:S1-C subfamily serine protease